MEKEYAIGDYCDFFGAYAKVYTLSDQNGNVFYVGCTLQKMETRIAGHIYDACGNKYSTNQKKNSVIRSLNYKVVVKIVDILWVTASTRKSAARQREIKVLEAEWILKFYNLGYDLCNKRGIPKFSVPAKDFKPEFIGQTFLTTESGLAGIKKILEENPESDVKESVK